MARLENHNIHAIHNILNENNRTAEKYKNDVDKTRTHLNWHYGSDDTHTIVDGIKTRCKNIMGDRKLQAKTNIMSTWCLTYPAELCYQVAWNTGKQDPDTGEDIIKMRNVPIDPAHCRKYFDTAYEFVCERYGKDNVMSCFVHMDETTPHIHMNFVPEATSRKTGQKTVSSASLITRKELSQFHRDLDAVMEKVFGVKHLVLNGRTKGDYSLEELKQRTDDDMTYTRRKRHLDTREQELNDRENAQDARESILNDKARELTLQEQKLREIALKQRENRKRITQEEVDLAERTMELDNRERKFQEKEDALEAQKRAIQERDDKSRELLKIASTEHTWYTEQQKSHAKTVQRMAVMHSMADDIDRRHQEQQNIATVEDILNFGR